MRLVMQTYLSHEPFNQLCCFSRNRNFGDLRFDRLSTVQQLEHLNASETLR